jgi:hypothetical protein
MANKIERIAETVGKDIVKGIEYPFVHTVQFVAVLNSCIKGTPAVKSAVIDLVKQAETVISDCGTDVADKGIDLTEDLKTLADAKAFFMYFKDVFVPLVETIYHEILADQKLMQVAPQPVPIAK